MPGALEPEEIALLIAIYGHAPDGKAYEFDADNAPTRKVISVGLLSFPPDLNNPGASLINQERWITALQSLRARNLLICDFNMYSLHGAGRELIRRAEESGKKTPNGGTVRDVLEAVNRYLGNLRRAQQGQINNPGEEENRKEVDKLIAELLALCGELQSAI